MEKRTEIKIAILAAIIILVTLTTLLIITPPKDTEMQNTTIENPRETSINNTIERIQESKDSIYYERAFAYNNNEFCAYIKNENLKEECYEKITENNPLPKDNRTTQEKKDDVNYERALAYDNRALCNQIQKTSLRNDCIAKTSPPPENNTTEEDETSQENTINNVNTVKDQTNYERALAYNDNTFLQQIVNEELKQKCIDEIN